jgi:hypothetical protein
MAVLFQPFVCRQQDGEECWSPPDDVCGRHEQYLIPPFSNEPASAYQRWLRDIDTPEVPNPRYDARLDFKLPDVNAKDVLRALALERHGAPVLIADVRMRVAQVRRNCLRKARTGKANFTDQGVAGPVIYFAGRPAGYLDRLLVRLSNLTIAAEEYEATHIGWTLCD